MVDEVEARPLPADDSLAQVKSFADLGRVWFIGIGGSGMKQECRFLVLTVPLPITLSIWKALGFLSPSAKSLRIFTM